MGKLKSITLTIADKQIIRNLIGKPSGKSDITVARSVREIRRRFHIRDYETTSENIGTGLRKFQISFNSWDDLLDVESVLEQIDGKANEEIISIEDSPAEDEKQAIADKANKEELAKLRAAVVDFKEDITYTIDDSYLEWMQHELGERDWSKISIPSREGGMKEVAIDVHPGQFEALADFDDKLMVIISGPSIEEERSLKKKEN